MPTMKQIVSAAADIAIIRHLLKVLDDKIELTPAMLTAINHRLKADFGSELGLSPDVAQMFEKLKIASYGAEDKVTKDMSKHIDSFGKIPPLEDDERYEHKA